jgi:hypothetical protein
MRCTFMMKCTLVGYTPMKYTPMRCTLVRCTPMRYTPVRCTFYKVHGVQSYPANEDPKKNRVGWLGSLYGMHQMH